MNRLLKLLVILCYFPLCPVALAHAPIALDLKNPDRAQDKELRPYMINLRLRLQARWRPAWVSGAREIVAHFLISPTGQPLALEIVKTSGVSSLDDSVLDAVKSEAPFPVPPRTTGELLNVTATFNGEEQNIPVAPAFSVAQRGAAPLRLNNPSQDWATQNTYQYPSAQSALYPMAPYPPIIPEMPQVGSSTPLDNTSEMRDAYRILITQEITDMVQKSAPMLNGIGTLESDISVTVNSLGDVTRASLLKSSGLTQFDKVVLAVAQERHFDRALPPPDFTAVIAVRIPFEGLPENERSHSFTSFLKFKTLVNGRYHELSTAERIAISNPKIPIVAKPIYPDPASQIVSLPDGRRISALEYAVIKSGVAPNSAQSNVVRGNCYDEIEKYAKAVSYYRKALALDPNLFAAQKALAIALTRLGGDKKEIFLEDRKTDAMFLFDSYPGTTNARLLLRKGKARLELNDYHGALLLFSQCSLQQPTYIAEVDGMGYVYLAKKDASTAIQYFDLALRKNESIGASDGSQHEPKLDLLVFRAKACELLGNKAAAEQDLQQAVDSLPK